MHDTDAFVTRRRLSTKECSVEARKILKAAFPGTKFSVRTEHGTSVNVSWTDGPTSHAVDALIGHLRAGHFDGMQDMYVYSSGPDAILANEDGTIETVEYGAHYVFTQREISDEWTTEVLALFSKTVGRELDKRATDKWGTWTQQVPLAVQRTYDGTAGELYHMVETDLSDLRDVFHRYTSGRSR
jgi:hypothetical protein